MFKRNRKRVDIPWGLVGKGQVWWWLQESNAENPRKDRPLGGAEPKPKVSARPNP